MSYKLGSLFDGSGGFPLAGALCGIEPVWASEVEPYPIAVTRERFPKMKHLSDVSKVNGAEIEPVDIITFGSPCQDLSVAGKRAGLKHEAHGDTEQTRSGLFYEAARIIKEMRAATNGKYPRFALWENVFGAFSSNNGEDFRCVLEELIKVVEPSAIMPPVPEGGWSYADSYIGDGWSVAYRLFDAQFWGVPQRRRRIHLVADFSGECAGEILFNRESLSWYSDSGGEAWEGAPGDSAGCVGAANSEAFSADGGRGRLDELIPTVTAAASTSGNNQPWVCFSAGFKPDQGKDARGLGYEVEKAPTLTTGKASGVLYNKGPVHEPVYCLQGGGATSQNANGSGIKEGSCFTLTDVDRHGVAYAMDGSFFNTTLEQAPCMRASQYKDPHVAVYPRINDTDSGEYIVRRLMPVECARLQGFPDWWGDIAPITESDKDEIAFWHDVKQTYDRISGKAERGYTDKQIVKWHNGLHTDAAEYKMWGNGIALPPALYCMQGISKALDTAVEDDWMN